MTTTLEKGKLTKERVITIAAELFRKNGFHNTSLAQILDEAKLTKGGFYFHFKSKEELGDAVINYMRDFWVHNVLDVVAEEKGALQKIETMFDIMIKTHDENAADKKKVKVRTLLVSAINLRLRAKINGLIEKPQVKVAALNTSSLKLDK